LLEDRSLRVVNSLADLFFRSVRAHNAVLALSSRLRIPPEVGLEVLVAVDGGLQPAVDLADLWRVPRVARFRLRLDVLDAGNQGAVARHDLRTEVRDLARRHVRPRQHLLECALQVV